MPVYEEKEKIDGQKAYYIRCYVEGPDGKPKQVSRHNKKKWIGREGKILAQQEEMRIINKPFNDYENMLLEELCSKYLEFISQSVKLSTLRKAEDNIRLYILSYFKNKKIQKLTTSSINEWHNFILEKNFSIRFSQDIHITLVAILNHGCKFYNLGKNVASLAGNFKNLSTEKNEMNILTTSEFDNFLNCEENDLYKSFFTILFYTGLRKGEALCLTVNDVDFNSNIIRIRKAYNPRNKEITSPKTKKANRDILMVQKVSECLKRLVPDENGFLFGFNKVTATTLSRKCKNNCKKANINKNIRIHDFRHSFASLCIANNIPIQIISNYMGHENISTTLDIYGHLYPNSQHQLIYALNDFLKKQDQKQDQKN